MATLETRLRDLATRIGTEAKALRTLINGNAADLSALTTTAKTSLLAAVNELKATVAGLSSGAAINDAATGSAATWSSQKITDQINAAIAAITGANVPTALDTLLELATAIQSDESGIAALTTSVGNRVRFDAAQTLTAPQKAQANTNMGSLALVDAGTVDTDFAAVFTAALA